MGMTVRLYWRDHRTGEVGLEFGQSTYGGISLTQFHVKAAAERYAEQIGGEIKVIDKKSYHVIKLDGPHVVGQYYFVAFTPLDVPLGEGWEGGGDLDRNKPLVFEFEDNGNRVTLSWAVMSQDQIDEQHGNDEFGGWYGPDIIVRHPDGTLFERLLDDTEAVRLMMMDARNVLGWVATQDS